MIIYPAIDLRQGKAVRLRQGDPNQATVYDANPVKAAERWVDQGAEWLHVVNLDGAFGVASPNFKVLERITEAVDVPIQFGGGLRSLEAVEDAFDTGVARIVLGTAAINNPDLLKLVLAKYGPESIVVGLDARDGKIATHGWQNVSNVPTLDLARRVAKLGATLAVYTDIARDGMLQGVDAEGTAALAEGSGLSVIASGGVASLDDIRRLLAIEDRGIDGVIIGQALYTGAIALPDALALASGSEPRED
ncbi:MAG: 1-(5-phosphoribosyl)-5-[(5-phosphoribosylamino)methylideneamino]imidazole-4-carboxamide isomerase [Anaerolineae bacterium]